MNVYIILNEKYSQVQHIYHNSKRWNFFKEIAWYLGIVTHITFFVNIASSYSMHETIALHTQF